MSPLGAPDDSEEQSEAERLRIARRYRERRGEELRELAAAHSESAILAAGEFSTAPIETLAAIPVFGALFAAFARIRSSSRNRITPNVLLAVDERRLHLLALSPGVRGVDSEPLESWSLDHVRVASVQPRFMREEVVIEIDDREPLKLYASSLRTNPWAAEVVRRLGGDAPEPLDLADPEPRPPAGTDS
jgi:hypothetical protein